MTIKNDLKYFCTEFLFPVVIVFIVVIPPIILGAAWYEKKSCIKYSQITEKNIDYSFFGGCFVQTDSGWLSKEEYGKTIIAKEGLMNKVQ